MTKPQHIAFRSKNRRSIFKIGSDNSLLCKNVRRGLIMSTSCRIFFVEENDRVRAISYARFRRCHFLGEENETFPEYAGKRLRYAFVIIDLEKRQPVTIRRSDFSIMQFDSVGRLDKADRLRGAALAVNSSRHV